MSRKALILDIDGTLFSHTMKKIPDSTVQALNELKEKAIAKFESDFENRLFISNLRHSFLESYMSGYDLKITDRETALKMIENIFFSIENVVSVFRL